MSSGVPAPQDGTRLREIVLREIERLDGLIRDFLHYARPVPPKLEPVPVLLMLLDTLRAMRARHAPLEPRLTWVFMIAMAVLHFVGAGLFGFAHTLPQVNYYTHGSQVTVSHGHLAFYGAYALVNLSFFYFAIPRLKAFPGARYDERAGHWGFWITSIGILAMSLALAVAGVLQSYLERYLGQPYVVAQDPMLWIDQVSLMPIDNVFGWRRDVAETLKALKPGIIRFGGSTTEGFEWTATIGDPAKRVAFTTCWGGLEPGNLGLEEFVQLCRWVGAEPLICVRFTGKGPQDAADQGELGRQTDALEQLRGTGNQRDNGSVHNVGRG